jgi:putative spermidine/putrescine transport system ATP-binding protein
LKQLQRATGLTCLYVTHDQDEALSMADVVAVMTAGQIRQIGSPVELYERPSSRFVASFLGKSNFMELDVVERTASGAAGRHGEVLVRHAGSVPAGPAMLLALRPEKIEIAAPGGPRHPDRNHVPARVLHASYLGNAIEIVVDGGSLGELTVRAPASAVDLASEGRAVELSWPVGATVAIPPDR